MIHLVGTDKPICLKTVEPLSEGLMRTFRLSCRPVKPDPHLGAFPLACHSDRDTAIQDVATSYGHGGISEGTAIPTKDPALTQPPARDKQTTKRNRVLAPPEHRLDGFGSYHTPEYATARRSGLASDSS